MGDCLLPLSESGWTARASGSVADLTDTVPVNRSSTRLVYGEITDTLSACGFQVLSSGGLAGSRAAPAGVSTWKVASPTVGLSVSGSTPIGAVRPTVRVGVPWVLNTISVPPAPLLPGR